MKQFFILTLIIISGCSGDLTIHLKIFDKRPFIKITAPHGINIINGIHFYQVKEINLEIQNIFESYFITSKNISEPLSVLSDIPVKKYYGSLTVSKRNGLFYLLNRVSEKHYLASVVGSELNSDFPPEACKAQAVASRTLLYYLNQNNIELNDLSSVYQAYRGAEFENPDIIYAVEAVKGKLLHYKRKLFFPYFHSTCGGYLLPPDQKRGISAGIYPGLTEIKRDEFNGGINCINSPYFHWETTLMLKDIEKSTRIMPVYSISLKKTADGWVKDVEITSKSNIIQTAYQFINGTRQKTSMGILSFYFKVHQTGSTFYFEGYGFGHHSGMCQWGARGLAKKGMDYTEILKFYYPGTEIY